MRDLELFILLKATIEAAEPDFGIPLVNSAASVPVLQSFQPTQQGVPTGPCIFMDLIGTQHVGQPYRADYLDEDVDPAVFVHEETQQLVSRFQISALATQDPRSLTQYTAEDLVNLVAMILKNSQTIAALEEVGCGITIGKDVRNPKFLDDRDRFEASPSFDFNISHKLIVRREQPVLQSQELQIIVI